MAGLNRKLSNASADAAADAVARLLDNGYLRLYDGTQAADADTAVGAQVLLAELRFNATSAPAAVAGLLTFNAITSDSSADASGTATWFRALKSDGTSGVMDGSVGTGGLKAITAATNANPTVLTHTAHGLTTGQSVTITGATGAWAAINGTWLIERVDANSFQIDVDSTAFGALAGSPVYRDSDIDMNSNVISAGASVALNSFTYQQKKS